MKKKLIATGLITVLAASNGYMAYTYIKDTDELKKDMVKSQQENREKDIQLSNFSNKIIKLQSDLKDRVTENEKLTVELKEYEGKIQKQDSQISKLKNELKTAKEKEESPRKLNMTVTAYVDSCLGCTGVSASGIDLRGITEYNGYKIIAADKNVLPMFSIVKIKLNNTEFKAIVLDRGGAIKGQIIDYLVGSYDEAVEFGRQKATVTVIREGKG
ncbi:hypothetical protein CHH57_02170 [Niallia circulans]|uniref:3D domain-containing protein n=1 Tax=Niallia circulans TaxID=1397 RepID=A0AA91TVT2_NIACI|nr:3D domain-containing protein [Niallia circulans]PAD84858.1 hypothetical protein CHH57_02170 [Niallia circulans]